MSFTLTRLYSAFVNAPLVGGVRQPDIERLAFDIQQNTTIATALEGPYPIVPINATTLEFTFAGAGPLPGPEETELDVVIAAHDGTPATRGTDTHTFTELARAPLATDDSTVPGVGGLPRYALGDLILDSSQTPADTYIARDLTPAAAVWDKTGIQASAVVTSVRSIWAVNTNNAISVSTSYGPIGYNSVANNATGYFTYTSPNFTCIKACRLGFRAQADFSVSSGNNRCGLRLDLRKNNSSLTYRDDDTYSTTAPDGQTIANTIVDLAINDTVQVYCRSYVGRVDVWGFANVAELVVLEDL
jgi:hypothetical protein